MFLRHYGERLSLPGASRVTPKDGTRGTRREDDSRRKERYGDGSSSLGREGRREERGRGGGGGRRRERPARRWYRVAAERNVVTFKLEWTTVCVPERVASGRCRPRTQNGPAVVPGPSVYTVGSLIHHRARRREARRRTYGRRIVFKTAGGSQALEPSCDLVLPQRAGPIALRLEAEFQYTRIFNERPTVPSPLLTAPPRFSLSLSSLSSRSRLRSRVLARARARAGSSSSTASSLLISTSFSSFSPSPAYSPDAFSSFSLTCSFFPLR